VAKFKRENQLDYLAAQIIVSNGAKQVIFNALMASLEDGHEVLLCAPYFGQYKDMVLILGGEPIELPCSSVDGFLVTPSALEAAITPNTRWVILNAPSNPSGALYTPEELKAIGDVLNRHPQVMVMADEIYEHIVFDNQRFVSFAAANPQLKERTLIVNGVSKAYAMTGWRIGYGAGNEELINAMVKVQSQISSGACSVAQAAAAAALNGPQDAFVGCDYFIGAITPEGKTIENDTQFTQYLLEDAKVAAVAGSAYGLSPFFRLSTATSEEILNLAIDRIAHSVAKLTTQAERRK